MLQLNAQTKIFAAVSPVDFRKGIDFLALVCKRMLFDDPFSGKLFIFRNRLGTAIKILAYDGNGFWLCMKRFSKGKLKWWPTSRRPTLSVTARDIQITLNQGTPLSAKFPEDFRKLDVDSN